jgi:hypothetical protein
MIHNVEIRPRADTSRVARYPWVKLVDAGDVLVIHGTGFNAASAQQAAGAWARRHSLLFITHTWRRPVQLLVVMRGA